MAGYILLDLEITDPEGFKEYLKLAGPTIKQYGGKVLVGGAVPENLEGDWHPRLLSIGEFESVEQALRWYHSEEYAPAKELRFKVAKNKAIVVQGIEPRTNGDDLCRELSGPFSADEFAARCTKKLRAGQDY